MTLSRVALYKDADPQHPMVRYEERQIMIDLLQIQPQHTICDVPAWGGYLAAGLTNITNKTQVICIEPSPGFAASIDHAFTVHCGAVTELPINTNSIDRVASLVGLHHLPEKSVFIREVVRVLKSGGRVGISEVVQDTLVARFLNGPVNRYTLSGHRGVFVTPGECSNLLTNAGCVNVSEKMRDLHWVFPTVEIMGKFCRGLLGMAKIDSETVSRIILDHFDVKQEKHAVRLPWSLVYCIGTKA